MELNVHLRHEVKRRQEWYETHWAEAEARLLQDETVFWRPADAATWRAWGSDASEKIDQV